MRVGRTPRTTTQRGRIWEDQSEIPTTKAIKTEGNTDEMRGTEAKHEGCSKTRIKSSQPGRQHKKHGYRKPQSGYDTGNSKTTSTGLREFWYRLNWISQKMIRYDYESFSSKTLPPPPNLLQIIMISNAPLNFHWNSNGGWEFQGGMNFQDPLDFQYPMRILSRSWFPRGSWKSHGGIGFPIPYGISNGGTLFPAGEAVAGCRGTLSCHWNCKVKHLISRLVSTW